MVISEAMAARVPVVVSDVCGAAAQVGSGAGAVLGLSEPNDAWVAALDAQLSLRVPVPRFTRGWDEVARECERIYESFLAASKKY